VEEIQGVYTNENAPAENGEFQSHLETDLDTLPSPDITLLPYERYRAFLTGSQMFTAVTSRGCPHKCIFCRLDHEDIRLISIDKIVDSMEQYVSMGVKEVEFYDETFNLNVKRVKEFAQKVIDRRLKFKWSFRGRVNAINAELLSLIKEAGCQRIQFGVEAGTDRLLDVLKKGITVSQIKECFKLTTQAKIDSVAYLILGNPSETVEEMYQTNELVKEIKPTYLEYSLFIILPGTTSHTTALEQKLLKKDYWREYAKNPIEKCPFLLWPEGNSLEKLEEIRNELLKEYYFSLSYIGKRLANINLNEVSRSINVGLGMVRGLFAKGLSK